MPTNTCSRGWVDDWLSNSTNVGQFLQFVDSSNTVIWDMGRDVGDGVSFFLHHVWRANPSLSSDVIFIRDEAITRVGIRTNSPNGQLDIVTSDSATPALICRGTTNMSAAYFQVMGNDGTSQVFGVGPSGAGGGTVVGTNLTLNGEITSINAQTVKITAGSGVPSSANNAGSMYFRIDASATAGARIWIGQGGSSWLAIAGV